MPLVLAQAPYNCAGAEPDGGVDCSSMMSGEVWTGVTYLLAATMIKAVNLESLVHCLW